MYSLKCTVYRVKCKASKLAFCARSSNSHTSFLQNGRFFTVVSPTSKSMFHAKLPSIFITCQKMPRLSGKIREVAQFAENTQHDRFEVLRLPRKMTMEVTKVLPPAKKGNSSPQDDAKVFSLSQKLKPRCETHWNVSATPACRVKRGYAMIETSKSDQF